MVRLPADLKDMVFFLLSAAFQCPSSLLQSERARMLRKAGLGGRRDRLFKLKQRYQYNVQGRIEIVTLTCALWLWTSDVRKCVLLNPPGLKMWSLESKNSINPMGLKTR